MSFLRLRSASLIPFTVLGIVACGDSTPPAASPENAAPMSTVAMSATTPAMATSASAVPAPKDLVDTAVAAGNFKILTELVGAADLAVTLKGAGPFTVLAPTDAAFAKLPAETVALLRKPENKAILQQILTYHVIAGSVMAASVAEMKAAPTVEGENLPISLLGASVLFGAGTAKATVTTADIKASNGVIHVIDTVLIPPVVAAMLDPKGKDIVDTAVAAGTFKSLAAALTKADLVKTLKGTGQFTVFAPTDAAFAKLGKAAAGLKKEDLTAVLTYHVVAGLKGSATVAGMNGKDVMTLGGKTFRIKLVGADVMLTDGKGNDVKVTTTDIATKNGLIHVIDTVMMPAK